MTIQLVEQVGALDTEQKAELLQRTLEQLTVREALDLVKHLEKEWDVEAKPSFDGFAPPKEEVEEFEQTEFSVFLKEFGQKKIAVVKALRQATGLSLKESKDIIDRAPIVVKEKLSKEDAEKVKSDLEAAGATVEIK